jgi:plasmid stabilization system protein ParE
VRIIEWTPDGEESLNEIIEYYGVKAEAKIAGNIFNTINKEIELLALDGRRNIEKILISKVIDNKL